MMTTDTVLDILIVAPIPQGGEIMCSVAIRILSCDALFLDDR